jgi:hypothetical protein
LGAVVCYVPECTQVTIELMREVIRAAERAEQEDDSGEELKPIHRLQLALKHVKTCFDAILWEWNIYDASEV